MWYQTVNRSEIDKEFHSFVNRGILCSGYKYPEDGGDLLLRNVDNRVQDFTASQPIKQHIFTVMKISDFTVLFCLLKWC
jgi:hypothetical protein